MKKAKMILSLTLCAALMIAVSVTSFAFEVSDMTYLYIDKGSIIIGDGCVSGYGEFGEKITEFDPDGYCITATVSGDVKNTITFDGGKNIVVLKDVSISLTSQFLCAVSVENAADVTLYLEGNNSLVSGESRAGVEISTDSLLMIEGDGSLFAKSGGQAGIGGGNGASNGTVIINSGTITAQSLYNSAGIGGGSSGSGGNITINGGNVTALGGETAAGIGGGCASDGGSITINGGTVTAKGGENGAGIGGGWYGEAGNITVNGGSVIAVGSSAENIGAGGGLKSDGPVDSDGNMLYPVTVDASELGNVSALYSNGKDNIISGAHTGFASYCLYLPEGETILALKPETSTAVFYKAIIAGGNASVESVMPYTCFGSAQIGSDDVIRGLSCSLNSLDGFIDTADGFTFGYNNTPLGTGKEVELLYKGCQVYSFTVLIYGDLNGDSMYDGQDAFIVRLMLYDMLNSSNTDSLYFEAADVNRNGNVDSEDMRTLEQAGLLLSEIQQSNSENSLTYESYISFIDQSPYGEKDESPESCNHGIYNILMKLVNLLKALAEKLTEFFTK